MIETNLVDFRSLEQNDSPARRNELMRGVASLFAFASERCTLEQIQIYENVLIRLADMVEMDALAHASSKIAALRRAPEGIVRRLASDPSIEVAGPVLTQSPVLNDHHLIALAESQGDRHLKAIARRIYLSEQLTDVMVARGDPDVKRVIAGNGGARLGGNSLQILLDQAMGDVETALSLGQRRDTPDHIIRSLVAEAADHVRKAMDSTGIIPAHGRMEDATRLAGERMGNSYWLGLYDFETAWERLLHQGGAAAVSENLLCKYAVEDRFADVVAVFALIGDLDLDAAKHWLVRTDTEPFLMIAKALGLRFGTIQAILKCGPLKHRLTTDDRRLALHRFQDIDTRTARNRIAVWHDTRMAV
jgi:Uncharacterised protein conserved in bacteria (DUF2336)